MTDRRTDGLIGKLHFQTEKAKEKRKIKWDLTSLLQEDRTVKCTLFGLWGKSSVLKATTLYLLCCYSFGKANSSEPLIHSINVLYSSVSLGWLRGTSYLYQKTYILYSSVSVGWLRGTSHPLERFKKRLRAGCTRMYVNCQYVFFLFEL